MNKVSNSKGIGAVTLEDNLRIVQALCGLPCTGHISELNSLVDHFRTLTPVEFAIKVAEIIEITSDRIREKYISAESIEDVAKKAADGRGYLETHGAVIIKTF